MYGLVDGAEEAIKNLLSAGVAVNTVVDVLRLRGINVTRDAVDKIAERSKGAHEVTQNNLRAKLLLKTWERINALEEACAGAVEADTDTLRELRHYIKLAVEILAEIDRWALTSKTQEEVEDEPEISEERI